MMQMFSASIARDRFAELRREALNGQEILIEDGRQLNSPLISIIATDLLDSLTDSFVFAPKWEEDKNGSHTVSLEEIDIIGYGETLEEASEVLATAASEYAELYFSELSFYLSPMVNRLAHYPYLRRIARCNGDITKVKKVLRV